ncbi:MAG: ATP-binding protein [Vulcanimicrobiaceae bacterium]
MAPTTLHGRLALLYALALCAALIAFAGFALVALDRAQKSALDERLFSAARASSALASEADGPFDAIDRRAFARVLGQHVAGAVVDRGGHIVASTVTDVPDAIVRGAGASLVARTVGSGDDAVRVVRVNIARSPLGTTAVVLWAPLSNAGDLTRRLALVFGFAIPVVVMISAAVGTGVARRGLRPLRAVAKLAADIEARDLSQRLDLAPADDELAELCATFDRMLDRLQAAFERERRFSADASHELRAPLSILRAEAELALARERSSEEYRDALRSIVVEADALEALTRDLLHAARAEPVDLAALPHVDLAGIAERAAYDAERLARTREIAIVRTLTPVTIAADAAALERATLALLDNALKYARRGGAVTIVVERTRDRATLEVGDDGSGFTAAALEHGARRFWRDRSDRSRSGTGLGLAIARTTIEASGGTMHLDNDGAGGARVRATFPVAASLPNGEPPRA